MVFALGVVQTRIRAGFDSHIISSHLSSSSLSFPIISSHILSYHPLPAHLLSYHPLLISDLFIASYFLSYHILSLVCSLLFSYHPFSCSSFPSFIVYTIHYIVHSTSPVQITPFPITAAWSFIMC